MQEAGTIPRKKFFEADDNFDPLTSKDFKITKSTLKVPVDNTKKESLSDGGSKSAGEEASKKKISSNWMDAIAIVKFDIDQGNVLEAIYPEDILNPPERRTLSFLAFPDSNSFSAEGALKYIFKFQRGVENSAESDTLFGYTYFQQRKDPSNPRGFSQKSLVILSALPFVEFFKGVLDTLGSNYFNTLCADDNETKSFLKKNYQYVVTNWQRPKPGTTNEVSICCKKFTVNIPKKIYKSWRIDPKEIISPESSPEEKKKNDTDSVSSSASDTEETNDITTEENYVQENKLSSILSDFHLQERGLFQDLNLYKLFRGQRLPMLWKLWESVLCNQPIMIMSDSPAESSEAVLSLVSLIYPLEYQGDYKPYFTIYDPCYKQMQEMYEKKTFRSIILGVTNPLFLKTMQNFPNTLHLEHDYLVQLLAKKSTKKPNLLKSIHKPLTQPDPTLKNMLIMKQGEESDAINNALLRKSLRTLTESFLSVFETYFKLQINDIKKFEEKDFLKFLELQKFPFKGHFASQSEIIKVYIKFLKSPNFAHYLKSFPNVYYVKSIFK